MGTCLWLKIFTDGIRMLKFLIGEIFAGEIGLMCEGWQGLSLHNNTISS